jgi:hypothetical protein
LKDGSLNDPSARAGNLIVSGLPPRSLPIIEIIEIRSAMIDSGLHPSSTALGSSILPEISFLPAAFRFQPLFVLCSLSLIASCSLFIV